MTAAGPTTPPAGFLDFCARSPQDCGLQAHAAKAEAPAVQLAGAQAQTPQARHGGYDWSAAFAAAHPARDGDQVADLRQQLYSRMWKTAFAADRPQAPATATAAGAAGGRQPVAETWGSHAVAAGQAAASPLAAVPPYLIRASYISLVEPGPWNDLTGDIAAPAAGFEPAPAAGDEAHAEPAVAAAPTTQPLVVTKALMTELAAVDRRINRAIIQTDDARLYGQTDYWATPIEDALSPKGVVRGDCEDYALEKRRALIAAGVPAEALSIAVADTRFGSHAVLLVDTDKGELVLDSLNRKIVAWDRTGYRWIKRQAWGDPMSWVEISQNELSGRN